MPRKILASCLVLALLMGLIAAASADEPEIVGGVELGAPRAPGQVIDTLAPSDPFVEGLNENETWLGGSSTYAADWFALQYIPTQDYTFTGAELILGGGVADVIFRLYDDIGGLPGNILSEGTFTQVADYLWQGTDLAPGVDVTAGTTYWFGFKPLVDTTISTAESGTLVTHSWDYGGDGWEGTSTSHNWMAKFFGVPTGGNPTMHVRYIGGFFSHDYLGRPILNAFVLASTECHMPLPRVEVSASIWTPCGGPFEHSRRTNPVGWARFHRGCNGSGTWTLCVDNLVLDGYDYAPDDNNMTCMDWTND